MCFCILEAEDFDVFCIWYSLFCVLYYLFVFCIFDFVFLVLYLVVFTERNNSNLGVRMET